jgi:hypothetical protein
MNTRRKPQGYIAREHIHTAIRANADAITTTARIIAGRPSPEATTLLANITLALTNQRESLDIIREIIFAKEEPTP